MNISLPVEEYRILLLSACFGMSQAIDNGFQEAECGRHRLTDWQSKLQQMDDTYNQLNFTNGIS